MKVNHHRKPVLKLNYGSIDSTTNNESIESAGPTHNHRCWVLLAGSLIFCVLSISIPSRLGSVEVENAAFVEIGVDKHAGPDGFSPNLGTPLVGTTDMDSQIEKNDIVNNKKAAFHNRQHFDTMYKNAEKGIRAHEPGGRWVKSENGKPKKPRLKSHHFRDSANTKLKHKSNHFNIGGKNQKHEAKAFRKSLSKIRPGLKASRAASTNLGPKIHVSVPKAARTPHFTSLAGEDMELDASSVTILGDSPSRCPSKKYWVYSKTYLTWDEHQMAAQSMFDNCQLASILSNSQKNKMGNTAGNSEWPYWLGGTVTTSDDGETVKEWVDGEDWSYDFWACEDRTFPPDDINGDCVQWTLTEYGYLGFSLEDCLANRRAVYKCCKPTTEAPEDLVTLLSSFSSDGGSALQTFGTPQYNAMTWLASDSTILSSDDQKKQQLYSLATIYYAMVGVLWDVSTNWLDGINDCGQWWSSDGSLICDDTNSVTKLNLDENYVQGGLPPEIGLLTALSNLIITDNWCTGYSIPPEIGNLDKLESLELWGNEMEGTIPAEIGSLTNLVNLELDHNYFTGGIPNEIKKLTNLESLELDDNNLTGTIPSKLWTHLTKLTNLELDDNELTGIIPTMVSTLSSLEDLHLSYNDFTSADPPSTLWEMSTLVELHLTECNLKNSIPATIGNLENLEELHLGGNGFTGSVPDEIWDLVNLEELYLWGNSFDPWQLSSHVSNLVNLKELYLEACGLTGSIPPEIWTLKDTLVELDLSGNTLTQSLSDDLGKMKVLEKLDLQSNELTGSIPPEIGYLANLWYLDISVNSLTGSIPAEIFGISKLEYLYLAGNSLSQNLSPMIGDLTNLVELDLDSSGLTGTIPTEIAELNMLEVLLLGENSFTTLPAELGNLESLVELRITSSGLTGAIPTEYGNMANLQRMELYLNSLDGSIPSYLGLLSNLVLLHLIDNSLTGALPSEILALESLEELYLSHNLLSGTVPTEVGLMTNAKTLALSDNAFTGTVPSEIEELRKLDFLSLFDNDFTGTIPGQLKKLTKLTELHLHGNELTGTIPSWIKSKLKKLEKLSLYGNSFTGTYNCPSSIAVCLISCDDENDTKCRKL